MPLTVARDVNIMDHIWIFANAMSVAVRSTRCRAQENEKSRNGVRLGHEVLYEDIFSLIIDPSSDVLSTYHDQICI